MKILYILLNLLCLIIFTACGGGNILSLTLPSKPIYTNPSPKPTTPKSTTPKNLNQPSPSTPNSPPTPPIITTSAIPLQHLIATKFPIANLQSITIPPPTIPTATIFDENTLKHIGVIDGGFGDLAAQYFNDSKVTFIGRQLPLKDRTHGTNVSNIIIRNAKNTTNLYVLEAGDTTDPTRKNLLTGFGHYRAIYNQGVRIFNNSFGTNPTDNLDSIKNIFYNLYDNLKDLASKEGAIFVWATGNESQDLASDQASLPELYNAAKKGWIAVTALDTSNKLASYANQLGRAKDWGIAALGTLNNDGTGAEGTSYAAPRVTAAVSKVWEQFPWMDNHLVTQTILSTANACEKGNCNQGDKPTTGPNDEVGWGALNVERALKGPARFDKRLLLQGQNQVEVNFSYRNYNNINKLTWSNDIAGDAGLKKEGTGTLYLSGNNTYSGKTDINGGALVLTGDGITQSHITIGQDGILQANNAKTITTAGKGLTNNGIFEVYGKGAKIAGNYRGGGQHSKIYINPDSQLQVEGTMDLANSKFIVHIPNITTLQSSANHSVIQAQTLQGYDGTYYVTPDSNLYADIQSVTHSNQEIKVQYQRNTTAQVLRTASYANTNTLNTAQNFDTLLNTIESKNINEDAPVYVAALSVLNAENFTRAIDSLSGEIHASSQNLLIQQNTLVNAHLNQRVALMQEEKESGFFMQAFGSHSKLAQKDYASANVNLYATLLGSDFRKDSTTLGFALLLGNAKADFNQYAGNVEILNRHISLYGTQHFEHFYITARVGIGFIKNAVKREINTEQTQSAHKDIAYNLYGEVGKIVPISFAKINAFLGLEKDYLLRGEFNENHPLGLVADKQKQHSNALSIGVRIALEKGNWRFNTALSHRHLLSPDDFSFEARSVGSDSKVRIQGIKQAQNITTLNVGGMLSIREDLLLDVQYNFSLQNLTSNYNQSIGIGLRYNY